MIYYLFCLRKKWKGSVFIGSIIVYYWSFFSSVTENCGGVTALDANEQRWNIHACWTSHRGLWDIISFPYYQGFHALFYQEEQRSLPTGLPETGWNLQSLGQNAGCRVSAVEWSTAGASWGYRLLPHIKNRKSEIHGRGLLQSHSVNWPQLCWSTFLQNQPVKNCFWALCDRPIRLC